MRIVQRQSHRDAILRRVHRAVSELVNDESLSHADKLAVLYALQYELGEHCARLESHPDGSELPASTFSGDRI